MPLPLPPKTSLKAAELGCGLGMWGAEPKGYYPEEAEAGPYEAQIWSQPAQAPVPILDLRQMTASLCLSFLVEWVVINSICAYGGCAINELMYAKPLAQSWRRALCECWQAS